jgi:hypothetical protein
MQKQQQWRRQKQQQLWAEKHGSVRWLPHVWWTHTYHVFLCHTEDREAVFKVYARSIWQLL